MWKLCVLVLYALAHTSSGSPLSRRLDANTYEEGSVIDMDYNRNWYRSEEIARAACSKDDGCKGYWERDGDRDGVGDGIFFVLNVTGSVEFSSGKPHWSVLSVKVKKVVLVGPPLPGGPPAPPIPTTYDEGTISDAEYPKEWYDSEEAVQAECSRDAGCKGYWVRTTGEYFILKAGSRTFSEGVPHHTVLVVKVKRHPTAPAPSSPAPAPPPAPAPIPVPTPTPTQSPTFPPAPPASTPTDPQYQKLNYRLPSCPAAFEITSQDECSQAITSLGVTAFSTWTGSREGMPRFCSLQKDTDTMIWNDVDVGTGRHDLAPVCKYTGVPTPPEPAPAPVPASRDTTTVAPEEWEYFLAFQESRKNGFSCPCGDLDWISCNGIGGSGKHFHSPNPEKVVYDCTLWIAAYWHAEDQAIQNYCSHNAKDGRSPRQRAEAVGAVGGAEHQICQGGHHSQGPGALRGLQTSPGHCNSMFDPSFRGFAVGHADGPNNDSHVWTIMYNSGGGDISDSESCIPDGYTATGDLSEV